MVPWNSLPGLVPRRYFPVGSSMGCGLVTGEAQVQDTERKSPHPVAGKETLRVLRTLRGDIRLPAYFPVTTFDYAKHPLDRLLQPYFKRLVDGIMVSYHYAPKMKQPFEIPTFIDSGGFVSLFRDTSLVEQDDHVLLKTSKEEIIHPGEVLDLQWRLADIAVTLDCLISPSMSLQECRLRQDLTCKNALYAIKCWEKIQKPRPLLFAALQAWDAPSAMKLVEKLASYPFAGYALGGMVPRTSRPEEILGIVRAIRKVDFSRPLHVFGIGTPKLAGALFENGVDSVDSSSFIQNAVSGRRVERETGVYVAGKDSNELADGGEIVNMRLALGNLADTLRFLNMSPFAGVCRGKRQERLRLPERSSSIRPSS